MSSASTLSAAHERLLTVGNDVLKLVDQALYLLTRLHAQAPFENYL